MFLPEGDIRNFLSFKYWDELEGSKNKQKPGEPPLDLLELSSNHRNVGQNSYLIDMPAKTESLSNRGVIVSAGWGLVLQ
jgi:hypothetical protein